MHIYVFDFYCLSPPLECKLPKSFLVTIKSLTPRAFNTLWKLNQYLLNKCMHLDYHRIPLRNNHTIPAAFSDRS